MASFLLSDIVLPFGIHPFLTHCTECNSRSKKLQIMFSKSSDILLWRTFLFMVCILYQIFHISLFRNEYLLVFNDKCIFTAIFIRLTLSKSMRLLDMVKH